jgi:hypothetical protein
MKVHELKTDPVPFYLLKEGTKTFEIRNDDRDFQNGDILVLKETVYSLADMKADPKDFPLKFTGRYLVKKVTHLLKAPSYGAPPGFAIMSLGKIE